ncbi:MAG: AraC family transcriptional regulator, partial [Mastigocladus sp. ERB_26_1]
ADVALQVGFTSQSHFTRHFKRLVGVTPKQLSN